MKELVIITELFYPSIGGQEVRYLEFGKVFVKNGWKVSVVTIDHIGNLPEKEIISDINVFRIIKSPSYQKPHKYLPRNPIAIINFTLGVLKFLKNHKADSIIFNQWPIIPQIAYQGKQRNLKIIDWCELRSGILWKIIQKTMAFSSCKHIVVNKSILDYLYRECKIKSGEVVESGINLDYLQNSYRKNSNKSGCFFFGRLFAHKHPEHVIEAMKIVNSNRDIKVPLTIAGGGPLEESLRNNYSNLEWLTITGNISETEKNELFNSHKINVLPSEREGFPRTVAECMVFGVPTITTDYPDNATVKIIHQYNCGIIVKPQINVIADTINSLLIDDKKYADLEKNCLLNSKYLDWEHLYSKFISFTEKDI